MALFERKSPEKKDLIALAADDYKRAETEVAKVFEEIQKVRYTPPCLADCMDVMKEVVQTGVSEFSKFADARLAYLIGPEFDRRYLFDLNLTMNQQNHSVFHTAVFALLGDEFLRFAESRLKTMGAADSKLTLAQKAKKLADLEARHAELSAIVNESLHTWQKLTNSREKPE